MKMLPTTDTPSMISAPLTVEYSIPSGPKNQVRTNATPTDFRGAITTMFVLP